MMNKRDRIIKLLCVSKRALSAYEISSITNIWFVYLQLSILENENVIQSSWIEGPYPKRRVYVLK